MISRCFFVDEDGNEVFNEEIGSHVALAIEILENNEKLNNEYQSDENSRMSTANFLQERCGYMRGSQVGEYKTIIFNSNMISEAQRLALRGYHEEGYHFIDTYLDELKQKQKEKKSEDVER